MSRGCWELIVPWEEGIDYGVDKRIFKASRTWRRRIHMHRNCKSRIMFGAWRLRLSILLLVISSASGFRLQRRKKAAIWFSICAARKEGDLSFLSFFFFFVFLNGTLLRGDWSNYLPLNVKSWRFNLNHERNESYECYLRDDVAS